MTNKCKLIRKNTKHYFVLTGRQELYFRQEVVACFKPFNRTKTRTVTSITPTFNADRKHYTYSFILPSSAPENDEHLEADHRKRVAEALQQIEEILMPKPRSKHKYCGVCRGHYEDYKEHTQGPEHLAFLKRSTYQAHIVQLCRRLHGGSEGRESKEVEESKIIDLTSEENPLKTASESELSPQKSSCQQE